MINWALHHVTETGSTQDDVMRAAESGAGEGYVMRADQMIGGRGRLGRVWTAPKGNLYLSFLLRPSYDVREAGQVSFVCALAAHKTLQAYLNGSDANITCKWPNDLLVNGKKISGILLESQMEEGQLTGLVVGKGMNIENAPEGAASLNQFYTDTPDISDVCDQLLQNFDLHYAQWLKDGFAAIRESWLSKAAGLGQQITVNKPDGQMMGIFQGLDEDGALLLQTDQDDIIPIHAGDVYFKDVS
jgi:BirA family biotin operon repressor/biotin-[acetyl-CoA-carboxylase] ligase